MSGKLPACLLACFGKRSATPENDASQLSVTPGPSAAFRSGFLSSFMCKRSCSRGTWDVSTSDAGKTRSSGMRNPEDCVTLATKQYLELFAPIPKNDDTSIVLSEARGAQDSIQSLRTADFAGSRSSTFTAMGRASREPSRLGTTHHNLLQPQPSTAASAVTPVLSGRRRSISSTRRSGQHHRLSEAPSPPREREGGPSQPPAQTAAVHGARRTSAIVAAPGPIVSPFSNKPHPLSAGNRSRSDRMSPSAAACLLPAPSFKGMARAQTALPTTSLGSGRLTSSASAGELFMGAGTELSTANCPESASGDNWRQGGATCSSTGCAGMPAPALSTAAGDGKHSSPGAVQRSRLHTENGSSNTLFTVNPGASPPPRRPGASSGGERTSCTLSQPLTHGSLGSAGTCTLSVPHRRSSIHFCRDGEVTVTGLPPSCLKAGRAPRCMKDSLTAAVHSPGLSSGPLLTTAGAGHGGAYTRRSVDGVYLECSQSSGGNGGPSDIMPEVFCGTRSHDSGSRCMHSTELTLTLNHGTEWGHGGGTVAAPIAAPVAGNGEVALAAKAAARAGSLSSTELFTADRNAAQQLAQGGATVPHGEQLSSRDTGKLGEGNPSQALATANLSIDSQRCEWAGGSSVLTQSRFSNSSRFTQHGNNTPGTMTATTGTGSLMSHQMSQNMLEKLTPHVAGHTCYTAGAGAASAPAAGTPISAGVAVAAAAISSGPEPSKNKFADLRSDYDDGCQTHNWCRSGLGEGSGFNGFPAGSIGSTFCGTGGVPLSTHEAARDVTSALTRLQEVCMAAVAQGGDMRSQRLCKRASVELPKLRFHAPLQVSAAEGSDERGSGGPCRIMGALGNGETRRGPGCSGHAGHRKSTSVHFMLDSSTHGVRGVSAADGAFSLVSSPPFATAPGQLQPALAGREGCAADEEAEDGMLGSIVCDEGIMLGEELSDGRPSAAAATNRAGAMSSGPGAGGGTRAAAQEEDDAYRTQMLQALLRGDFLNESNDSVVGESDTDEEVVEYRYGGFELGGNEVNCSFSRQASFVEAVRKCKTATNLAAMDREGG